MPKQLVCQNREESAVGESVVVNASNRPVPPSVLHPTLTTTTKDLHHGNASLQQQQQQKHSSPLSQQSKCSNTTGTNSSTTTNNKPSHRLGSFAFQPYQLFSPTPYAKKIAAGEFSDDAISNGSSTHSTKSSNSSDSYHSKELLMPINLKHTNSSTNVTATSSNKNNMIQSSSTATTATQSSTATTNSSNKRIDNDEKMMIIDDNDEKMITTAASPARIPHKPLSPPPSNTTATTHHLGSTTTSMINNQGPPQIKLPPTSMYPYTPTTTGISPPLTLIQPLPPLPSISNNSMRSLVGNSPKVQKSQGFASPKTKSSNKKSNTSNTRLSMSAPNMSAHLTTSNFSAVVNSGPMITKSFGSPMSTTQNFYANSPTIKSTVVAENNSSSSNPYIASSLPSTTQNENVNTTNIMITTTSNVTSTSNQMPAEKKEALPIKPIPKLPFGTLSLMN